MHFSSFKMHQYIKEFACNMPPDLFEYMMIVHLGIEEILKFCRTLNSLKILVDLKLISS